MNLLEKLTSKLTSLNLQQDELTKMKDVITNLNNIADKNLIESNLNLLNDYDNMTLEEKEAYIIKYKSDIEKIKEILGKKKENLTILFEFMINHNLM